MRIARPVLAPILAAAAAAGLAVVVHAADPEPQRPRDVMVRSLETLAAHVQNASVKLKVDARGFGRTGRAPAADDQDLSRGGRIGRGERPETRVQDAKPAVCCGRNLEAIREQMGVVRSVLVEYTRRLSDADRLDEQAKERIGAMQAHWKAIEDAMTVFAATDSREAARSALGAAAGEVADLRTAHEAFLDCCAPRSGRNQQ